MIEKKGAVCMEFTVWDIQKISAERLRQWFGAFSPAQQQEVLALRRTESRVSRLCAHRLALEMLSRQSGLPMAQLAIAADTLGKPQVMDVPLQFNISHSGNFVACAVDGRPVGVDIEVLRPVRPALAARVCCPEELDYAAPGGELDPARFFEVWTAKEALLKYRGTGIRGDLRAVRVVREGHLHVAGLRLLTRRTGDYVLSIVSEPSSIPPLPDRIEECT